MSKMHHSINDIEIPARKLKESKEFFRNCFGWEFTNFCDPSDNDLQSGLNTFSLRYKE